SWLRSEGGVACRSYRAGRYFRPDSKEPVVAAAVLGGRQGLHVGETWAVTGPTGREAPTCPESRVRSVSWVGANDVHAGGFGGDHGRAGDRGRLPLGPVLASMRPDRIRACGRSWSALRLTLTRGSTAARRGAAG